MPSLITIEDFDNFNQVKGCAPQDISDKLTDAIRALDEREELARMSHRGGGERRKLVRSADGGRSTSGNHRTDFSRRACSPSLRRGFRFLVRERHTTAPDLACFPIGLAAPSLS